uniref:Reverse transcriptase/retrotransposon-derived protein RNase H-like domain-containing protein n=1 Tax=Cyprinodon variegatus TaxID=28743 RepID=A0A3Q2EEQ4_CYPVA
MVSELCLIQIRHAQALRESLAVTSSPEFRPSLPEKFSGNMKDCKGFLFQCRLIFQNSPGSFPTDQKKITFILSQLTGRALEWPDPTMQFILEVDASDSGVGAVLSQRLDSDQRVHPCAFFSRRLSPAEQNYDVGDRELLAIKLALEE